MELQVSTEGGEAVYYYQDGKLEKIITTAYGETYRLLSEYYLPDGKISFVYEKHLKYNRPFYYDSSAMKENLDNEVFDLNKSELVTARSYFENGQLLHQISNQDCGSPFADEYLSKEQKRLQRDFDNLLKLQHYNTNW